MVNYQNEALKSIHKILIQGRVSSSNFEANRLYEYFDNVEYLLSLCFSDYEMTNVFDNHLELFCEDYNFYHIFDNYKRNCKKRKDLYFDIDGVLLSKIKNTPKDIEKLLFYAVNNFNCYWLTTHCKGNSENALKYLSQFYSNNLMAYFSLFKPTFWETLKTEGINFDNDFYWLEDAPFDSEKIILNQYGCENSLIIVNLSAENEINNVISTISCSSRFNK